LTASCGEPERSRLAAEMLAGDPDGIGHLLDLQLDRGSIYRDGRLCKLLKSQKET
jgi:hypothetical protein